MGRGFDDSGRAIAFNTRRRRLPSQDQAPPLWRRQAGFFARRHGLLGAHQPRRQGPTLRRGSGMCLLRWGLIHTRCRPLQCLISRRTTIALLSCSKWPFCTLKILQEE
jgi:hypothetical protein